MTVDHQMTSSVRDVDSGWAWMVLGASFFNQLVCAGLAFVAGMFQVIFLEEFNGSVAFTSWVTGLFSALLQLAGPMASSVSNLYGCRTCVILGGFLLSIGFFVSGLVDSLEGLMISFGAVAGLGMGMTYISSIVVINFFFVKRRTLVNGMASSAGGFGIMLAPQVSHLLFEHYNWREALFILAGISAHICIAGALMFPVHEKHIKKDMFSMLCCRKGKRKGEEYYEDDQAKSVLRRNSGGGDGDEDGGGGDGKNKVEMKSINECIEDGMKTSIDAMDIRENGDDNDNDSDKDIQSKSDLACCDENKYKNDKTICDNQQNSTKESEFYNVEESENGGNYDDFALENQPKNTTSSVSEKSLDEFPLSKSSPSNITLDSESDKSDKILCADSTSFSAPNRQSKDSCYNASDSDFLQNYKASVNINKGDSIANVDPPQPSTITIPPSSQIMQENTYYMTDDYETDYTIYENEKAYKSIGQKARQGDDVDNIIDEDEKQDASVSQSPPHSAQAPKRLYKNAPFLVLCLAMFVNSCGSGCFLIHVPSFLYSLGLSGREVTNVLSVNGLAILIGRFLLGALVNSQPGKEALFLIALQIIGGTMMALYPVLGTDYGSSMGVMFVLASYCGTFYTLLPTLTILYVGLTGLSTAFGIEMVCSGVGFLIAPPLSGMVVDLTDNYDVNMYAGGALFILAGLICTLLPMLYRSRKTKTDIKNHQNKS